MARRTAGQKFEPQPGDKPEQESSDLEQKLQAAAQEVAKEKFPESLKESTEALKKLAATEVKSESEWKLLQPRLIALRKHVVSLQQGLPVLPSASTDHDHTHMQKVMREMQLKQLVRTNPLIKDLLTELDALKKEKVPSELTAKIKALESANADLTTKLAEAQAKILELTKSKEQ